MKSNNQDYVLLQNLHAEIVSLKNIEYKDSSLNNQIFSDLFSLLLSESKRLHSCKYSQYMLEQAISFQNWPLMVEACVLYYSSIDNNLVSIVQSRKVDNIFNQCVLRLCMSGVVESIVEERIYSLEQSISSLDTVMGSLLYISKIKKLKVALSNTKKVYFHLKKLSDYRYFDCSLNQNLYEERPLSNNENIQDSNIWKMTKPIRILLDKTKGVTNYIKKKN